MLNNFYVIYSEIRQSLKQEVAKLKETVPDFQPGLAIVQVGGREDSNVYIRMKIKAASEIGMHAEHIKLPKSTTEFQVGTYIFYYKRIPIKN